MISLLETSIAVGRQVEEDVSQSENRFRSIDEFANYSIIVASGEGNM